MEALKAQHATALPWREISALTTHTGRERQLRLPAVGDEAFALINRVRRARQPCPDVRRSARQLQRSPSNAAGRVAALRAGGRKGSTGRPAARFEQVLATARELAMTRPDWRFEVLQRGVQPT